MSRDKLLGLADFRVHEFLEGEAVRDVSRALARVLVAARAGALAVELAEEIADAKAEREQWSGRAAKLREQVQTAEDNLVSLRAARELAMRQADRVQIGVATGDAPDVSAARDAVSEAERALRDMRARLTSAQSGAHDVSSHVLRLEQLLRALEDVPEPDSAILAVIGAALSG